MLARLIRNRAIKSIADGVDHDHAMAEAMQWGRRERARRNLRRKKDGDNQGAEERISETASDTRGLESGRQGSGADIEPDQEDAGARQDNRNGSEKGSGKNTSSGRKRGGGKVQGNTKNAGRRNGGGKHGSGKRTGKDA